MEPVEWLPDGTPRSPRFNDIYRSTTGGLEQARHVFLRGCGLPQAWEGRHQWRILETGFGLGMNFLAAWQAWKADPQRPRILHFVSIEAWPVGADDIRRNASPYPELAPFAEELIAQWIGLRPGVHRLAFEGGQVLLTLHINDVKDALRREAFVADSVFLDGFDPETNPAMWEPQVLKAVGRHCRRGARIASWCSKGEIRRELAQHGFTVKKAEGLPPKRHALQGEYDPSWEPKGPRVADAVTPTRCVVVGAGLAGAAVASSLARRGWSVTVLDAAASPAAGASGLPAGMLAPHYSVDDNLLSRLCREGVRATLQQASLLLREQDEWSASGVLERREEEPQSLWHEHAGWIKPGALVRAWLSLPGIVWQGNARVDRIVRDGDGWSVFDAQGAELARAPLVIVAAAHASAALLSQDLSLTPVRGQVSWGMQDAGAQLPRSPVKGNGHFIPHVPLDGGLAWYCGSTFDRGETSLEARSADHESNRERLRALLPEVEQQLASTFETGAVRAWTGVRCTSSNRRPIAGEIEPGLWVSTAMGSRGLTFAHLCAELIAARLHAEPLPVEHKLADSIYFSLDRNK